ncbi:lysoplasmalogenase family protein [Tamlana sp. 2201CG12-4]|uniref:lysoplasmalogenase family protein n=1 Tax=Tamlana sp. 2201CG12-4 TaxID=3112582 RepID=UPI002DBF0281|nr:lysoplasmalogenase family protein [Tamlana sp. 2201CG12-4]MEC3908357.1 lysoplasmalogenase family protein [Tamlana sp. 2201CG12-4]
MPLTSYIQKILKSRKQFGILFFTILTIDILVKECCPVFPYRYISKPPVLLLLILYYYSNQSEVKRSDYLWTVISLVCFFMGDILIINHMNVIFLSVSLLLFTFGKLFLSFRFSHKSDFKVTRLIPFSIIMFIYTVGLVSFLYDGLKNFFVPVIISYFISLLLFQFTFLRKDVVDKASYLNVFFGVIIYMMSEGIMVIKTFKTDVPLQGTLIMLFYGTGLYLIVSGILLEKKIKKVVSPF